MSTPAPSAAPTSVRTPAQLAFRPGIASWVTRHADRTPDRPAFVLDAKTVTYADLERRTWQVATALRGLGVAPGERVAVLHDNHREFMPAVMAIMRLGAIYVPLNPRLADTELGALVGDSRPTALITQQAHLKRLPTVLAERSARCLFTDGSPGAGAVPAETAHYPQHDAPSEPFGIDGFGEDAPAGLFYTSGTTGLPKGAMITHRSIRAVATQVALELGFTRTDRPLVSLPISVSGAMLAGVLPFVHLGCSIRLLEQASVESIAAAIGDYRPTYMATVPTVYQMLLDHPSFDALDLSCFGRVLSSAAAMPVSLIERFAERGLTTFVQGYGLTESCGFSTCLMPEDAVRKVGSIGKPMMDSDVRVFVAEREAAPGEIGELRVSGPAIMAGYWERPDEPAIVDGWLHTGDLGHADEEGYLYVDGRLKDMIISGGYNVYPAEVENVIHTVRGVSEAAVIGVPDERWGEHVVAVVRPQEGVNLSEEQVLDACRARLAGYKVPKQVRLVATALPVNATGKIIKARLREAYAEGTL